MNVAFFFNSDHPSLGTYYGPPVMKRILGTRALQKANRHMRVSIGDILTYGAASSSRTPTKANLIRLCRAVYRPKAFDRLIIDRLEATHGKATVYCWLFQNMPAQIAESLVGELTPDAAFLGAMDVDFTDPLHLRFFRNSLCERYRLNGRQCSLFYEMGDNEDPDLVVREIFEQYGFRVSYEDIGARHTIFDSYDTIEHFRRVDDFKVVFAGLSGLDADQTADLVLSLEELHPKLFDAFASAARALKRAETEDDLAQAALSGRRLLERTADYLFPPQKGLWKGRKIGQAEYKNRLWAYIERTMAEANISDTDISSRLGKEVDRLFELFNAGLHSDSTEEETKAAFRDLVTWLSRVIGLAPAAARRPYLAYEQGLRTFLQDAVMDKAEED